MRAAEVSDGVFLVEHGHVNSYLVAGTSDTDGLTLIDSGLPRGYQALAATLRWLGRDFGDIRGLVLTHGHFDHVGTAKRLVEEHRIPVWVHEDDRYITRHPYSYEHERARTRYPVEHPRSVPVLAAMAAAGALAVHGVDVSNLLQPGVAVDLPGQPIPLATPGHTAGHCGFHLADRGVLISGDALVTFDPYTAERGPRIVARAATADSDQAMRSLAVFEETDAALVLPGHGEPWRHGIREAVDAARVVGVA
ncbi:Zn-dependent hydrolase [Leifsonia sp. Root1293]|nr:Zn-dependent hydrolase [Leifsonia sp. Root1293]KRA12448.1 Zn-dependent hydrolase [Leifsonia sp. Root60]